MKLKVGDLVLVTSGKDKGKQGKITAVFPQLSQVIVQGMNMYTRNVKPMMGRAGERLRKERPLHAAKVSIVNPDTGKADRVGYKVNEAGEKVRIFKKTGKNV